MAVQGSSRSDPDQAEIGHPLADTVRRDQHSPSAGLLLAQSLSSRKAPGSCFAGGELDLISQWR